MIGAGGRPAGQGSLAERHELPGKWIRPGWLTLDVADDIQVLPVGGGAQDRGHEIPAVLPVEPGSAHHEAPLWQDLPHRSFAGGLAAPVGVHRSGLRLFLVSGSGVTGKHVIR